MSSQPSVNPARERILDAAEQLVSELGAGRLTLDQVAQAAKVSKGGLLYHFPSKEALLLAMGERFVSELWQCRRAARAHLPDEPAADLKSCVLGVLCRAEDRKGHGVAILAAAANDPALVAMFRNCVADFSAEMEQWPGPYALKSIVSLAMDGLMLREALGISTFTPEQRDAVVHALLQLADESCRPQTEGGPQV